jgi:hypothetical protein
MSFTHVRKKKFYVIHSGKKILAPDVRKRRNKAAGWWPSSWWGVGKREEKANI